MLGRARGVPPAIQHFIDARQGGIALAGGDGDLVAHVLRSRAQDADTLGAAKLDACKEWGCSDEVRPRWIRISFLFINGSRAWRARTS